MEGEVEVVPHERRRPCSTYITRSSRWDRARFTAYGHFLLQLTKDPFRPCVTTRPSRIFRLVNRGKNSTRTCFQCLLSPCTSIHSISHEDLFNELPNHHPPLAHEPCSLSPGAPSPLFAHLRCSARLRVRSHHSGSTPSLSSSVIRDKDRFGNVSLTSACIGGARCLR